MPLLIRNVRVADPASSYHQQKVDLLIRDGQVASVGEISAAEGAEVWELDGAWVSPGWMDIGAWIPDPGFEQRETFTTAGRAAAAGGFTRVAVFPNARPVVSGKREVRYVREANPGHPVAFLPLGALTEDCAGKDITEMLDMREAGAVAFSDGIHAIQESGVMLRVLEYAKKMDAVVIHQPCDLSLAPQGQIHEGTVSTRLGLPGLPTLSETLMIDRDLALLDYADSRLHVHGLSSAASVARIRSAKARGARVTCSVPALNLLLTHENLEDFDAYCKLMPPLRTEEDRLALVEGVLDGTIDVVASNHRPLEEERKQLEFFYADFGAIGLETVFPILLEVLGDQVDESWLARKLSWAPNEILGTDPGRIETGSPANFTLFTREESRRWGRGHYQSASSNTPIHERNLPGRVLGLVQGNQVIRLSD